MRSLLRSVSVVVLAAFTTCAFACSSADSDPAADDSESTTASEAAFTGAIPALTPAKQPPGTPKSWPQPPSTGIVEQNGYCGATAAANLLRWYAREVSPNDAIAHGCWSYVGTLAPTLGDYFEHEFPKLGCSYERLPETADALGYLRNSLADGKPVVAQFMTGELNAHWITIVGVQGSGNDPKLVVMSWGRYYTAQWSVFELAWHHAWGGPFPHVKCTVRSPLASALHVDAY